VSRGAEEAAKADAILVSHGHGDHIDDLLACARDSGAPVVAVYELCDWLGRKGLQNLLPMNKGGSLDVAGVRVTMTAASHSSGYVDDGRMVYMGEAAGFVVRLEDGRTIYFAGDTDLFGDMRLIGELYQPSIAFLPIGTVSRWDPAGAARASAMLAVAAGGADALGHVPALDGNAGRAESARAGGRRRARTEAGRDGGRLGR
jgi:L-ascorbate metabolism protein UlaG (beta-lactamase superfamily)